MKTGFVAVIGRPNVGKSTLVNRLLGEKLSIVTPKPQTTRNPVRGILSNENAQIIFIDTPGLLTPHDDLHRYMLKSAHRSFGEADLFYLMVEPAPPPHEDCKTLELLRLKKRPVFLLINKIDTVERTSLLPVIDSFSSIFPFSEIIPLSAHTGDQADLLLTKTLAYLPEGEKLFPDDIISDQPTRFLVGEMIREKIFLFTRQEIPYGSAIRIDEFSERDDGITVIRATVITMRESHKGIIIGKKGAMIKRIGSEARRDIESFLGTRVFLDLRVKVLREWKKNRASLRRLGYEL